MKKRIALITGASGGIGKQIACKLAKENYSLYLHYNQNEQAIKDLMKQLNSFDVELFLFMLICRSKMAIKNWSSRCFCPRCDCVTVETVIMGLFLIWMSRSSAEMVQLHVTKSISDN